MMNGFVQFSNMKNWWIPHVQGWLSMTIAYKVEYVHLLNDPKSVDWITLKVDRQSATEGRTTFVRQPMSGRWAATCERFKQISGSPTKLQLLLLFFNDSQTTPLKSLDIKDYQTTPSNLWILFQGFTDKPPYPLCNGLSLTHNPLYTPKQREKQLTMFHQFFQRLIETPSLFQIHDLLSNYYYKTLPPLELSSLPWDFYLPQLFFRCGHTECA